MALLIILLGLLLRCWDLEKFAGFDYDQEIAAFWVWELIVNKKFSSIGQEISVGGVFIGPFFYYFLAPFYFLANLYPLGGNIFMILISLLNMVTIYLLAKRVFNHVIALLSIFLYAVHPGIIALDRTVAPSGMIILLSSFTALIVSLEVRRFWHYLLLGIALGLTFSVHPTAVILIPVVAVYLWIKRVKIRRVEILAIVLPLVIMLFPLIWFDFRHGGLIFSNALQVFLANEKTTTLDFWFKMENITRLLLTYWAGLLIPSDAFWIKFPLFILVMLVLWKSSAFLKLLVAFTFIFLFIYPRHIPEYYFLVIAPIVLVFTVGFLQGRYSRVILGVIVIASTFISANSLRAKDNGLGLYYKNKAVEFIASQAGSKPVTVYYLNDPGQRYGFNYLLRWHKINLVDGSSEKKFLIVVPESLKIDQQCQKFGKIKVCHLQ